MSAVLERVRLVIDRLGRLLNAAAGWLFIVCALFVTFDVLGRKFFGISSQATVELTGYMLALGIAWGLTDALTTRAHIRVDVLVSKMPLGIRAWMHAAALTFLGVLGFFLTWRSWAVVQDSWDFNSRDSTALAVPLIYPQGLWALGITLFFALTLVMWLEVVVLLALGRSDVIDRLLGPRTLQEEAAEALEAAHMADVEAGSEVMIAMLFLVVLMTVMMFVAPGGAVGTLVVLSLVFLVFFCAGIYVAAALGMLGLVAGFVYSNRPLYLFMGEATWIPSVNFVLVAVPLFLLMGEILLRSGLSDRLYRSLNLWFGGLPGGLLHTNIVSCAVFSAIAGSSVATAATIGSVALPYFERTKYSQRMVLGSLAAGGALGNLIPPGISFIIYGLITETSVGKLYLAAFIPGFMMAGMFMLVILAYSLIFRGEDVRPEGVTWRVRWASLRDLVPTSALILIVLGTIYGGLATPTEAAALGVVGAMLFAALDRKLTVKMLHASARATARTTSLIGLIILAGFVLNYVLSQVRLPQTMAEMVRTLALPSWGIMAIIIGFYLALGTFMEGVSMIITTLPVVFPVVLALGYDPIWFGVIVTMLMEIAMISPPDGTVMYVLQGMRIRPGPITDVFIGATPFVLVYMAGVVVLMIFPDIALWLPRVVR